MTVKLEVSVEMAEFFRSCLGHTAFMGDMQHLRAESAELYYELKDSCSPLRVSARYTPVTVGDGVYVLYWKDEDAAL